MFMATNIPLRLLWFVLFCYPHALTAGMLPLNIGMDDVFILALGMSVIIKRILSSGSVRFGFAFRAALLFWLLTSCSDLTGALTGSAILWQGALKNILKGVVYVVFAIIMDNTLDNETDIKSTLNWVLIAGFFGAITVIGQHYYETSFQVFTLYRPESWQEDNVRGGGAFLGPNAGGIMMMIFMLLAITRLRIGGLIRSKSVILALCAVFIAGIVTSQSRSAMLGMAAAAVMIAFFSPLRRYAIIVAIIAIPLLMYTHFSSLISERFMLTGESASDRKMIWLTIIQTPSPFIFFCGRGAAAEFEQLQATPHNTYIHILFELGLLGTIWAIWFFRRIIKYSMFINKSGNSNFLSCGNWCIYTLIGLAVAGMAGEMLFISFVKYILFFMAALSYRAARIETYQVTH